MIFDELNKFENKESEELTIDFGFVWYELEITA